MLACLGLLLNHQIDHSTFIFIFGNIRELSQDIDNLAVSKALECDVEQCLQFLPTSAKRLTVLAQNIRSIGCNMVGFEIFMTRLNFQCDVIVLTECWLHYTPVIPTLEGYCSSSSRQNFNKSDGIVVFVKQEIGVSFEEPQFNEGNCLVIKINKNTAIVAIYRSPSFKNIDNFLMSLNNVLNSLTSFANLIITGDINISINSENCDENSHKYLSLVAFYGLLPAHYLVTREASSTCLDHVILRTNLPATTLVLNSTLTDHKPTLLCLEYNVLRNYTKCTFNKINYAKLKMEVFNIDLKPIYESCDPHFSMSYLISQLQTAITNNTTTVVLPRRKKIIKPWMTDGLLRCIRNRDNLHKKSRRFPNNDILKLTYTRYRNFCNSLITKVKRAFEKKKLDSAGNNTKKLWSAIREISGTKIIQDYPKELLTLCDSPESSVNKINNFFVNVGKDLAGGIATDNLGDTRFNNTLPTQSKIDSFALMETDVEEVERLIMGLKVECSVGWDGISNNFLKEHKDFLVPPLAYIFNSCLDKGIFPNDLKKSLVIPIHKGGDRDCINNYRPISILPSISKLLERLINNRLTNYLENNHILSDKQFGFRTGKSTNDAVHELTAFISRNLDNRKKCLAIFLDLAKAFDTVSVPLLISKLEHIGVRGVQLALFRSYLSDRFQSVKVGEFVSGTLQISHGVPQGSILGPTLFLIYINELCQFQPEKGKLISYADDTVLMFAAETWVEVFDVAQTGFNTVTKWLHKNILTLNIEKTKFINFSLKNVPQNIGSKLYAHSNSCLSANVTPCLCKTLASTLNIKYLGITIDNNFSFKNHISLLCGRIRKMLFVFKKLKPVADPEVILQVYLALCQSIITYCISSWGGAAKTTLMPIEISQRAVLKVSTGRPFLYPTELLYKSCDVLTVRQLFILSIILKQHSMITFDPHLQTRRRKYNVCNQTLQIHTSFIRKFVHFLGPFLYNKINKILNIYSLSKHELKIKITRWLKTLTYDQTEDLLKIIS